MVRGFRTEKRCQELILAQETDCSITEMKWSIYSGSLFCVFSATNIAYLRQYFVYLLYTAIVGFFWFCKRKCLWVFV